MVVAVTRRHPLAGLRKSVRRLGSAACLAVVLGLIAFHTGLLRDRVAQGALFDAATASRWLVSAVVLGAFLALHRHGVSVLWGRKAAVLWLLVLVLHIGAQPGVTGAPTSDAARASASGLFLLPSSLLPVALAFVAAAWAAGARREKLLPSRVEAFPTGPANAFAAGFAFSLAPRPPPA